MTSACLKRESNFELIRIFAMLMIIGSHLALHGVMHGNDADYLALWREGKAVNQIFSSALTMGGEFGVALFFTITGYFIVDNDDIKLTKILSEAFYYGAISIVVFIASFCCGYYFSEIGMQALLMYTLKTVFIPVTGGSWWFITAYVFLVLLHPIINKFVSRLNKKGYAFLIFIAWMFWYTLGNALGALFVTLQKGVFFYLIGGYVKNYGVIDRLRKKRAFLLFALFLSIAAYTVCAYIVYLHESKETLLEEIIVKLLSTFNTAMAIPIAAAALFLLLGGIPIKHSMAINKIASTTLGVYLLHDSVYARSVIWRGILKIDTLWYGSTYFPLAALCSVILVFAVCSALDLLRIKYIEPVMIRKIDTIKAKLLLKFSV